ncbi:hypothetical protein SXCC_02421 [Gluconacetobacter sp. SXCC-1]|nr:hypothetical protein SXCC_02421 [Gluconacetobacter sp. SXCC-1]
MAPAASTAPAMMTAVAAVARRPLGGESLAVTTACVSVFVFHESDIHPDISKFKIYLNIFFRPAA